MSLEAFRAAVAALYKSDECPISVFGTQDTDGSGDILWLEEITNPAALPPYWTLSVPVWYRPEMGNLHVPKLDRDTPGIRAHHQDVCLDGTTIVNLDVFPEPSPFLVFEVDYLLGKTMPPELKKLQREAMAYAFQVSGFPFAVLTDSGGKSIHATVRLDDDFQTIAAWRTSPEFQRLQDLAFVVFGHYDQGVLKQSGKARLVRTPGATRDDGSPQTILAVGQRVSIAALTQWFLAQLSPEAQAEVMARQPIIKPESPLRHHYLRLEKWRADLLQQHQKGERGTHWMYVSKALSSAGCVEPRCLTRPSPACPYGQWQASWLWHVSAFVFDRYSGGWFFEHQWENANERTRWWGAGERQRMLQDQRQYEGSTDPITSSLVDQMLGQAQQMLPLPPPDMQPPPFVSGITGATLEQIAQQVQQTGKPFGVGRPPGPDKGHGKQTKKGPDYEALLRQFATIIAPEHLIKLSPLCGDAWYRFFPQDGIWKIVSSESILQILQTQIFTPGAPQKFINELYSTIRNMLTTDQPWEDDPHAIAFLNGTLYVENGGIEFDPAHNPADKLRSIVPCVYDPKATCPRWEAFVQWALPEPSRLSLLQEAFGYTLIPGQPFQSFFMFTGAGANGKSVVLAVLQALHKDSFETVALSNLGSRFSLGTIGRKRLAIDTEAENVNNQVMGEGNSATAVLKSWTGGDPVKIEAKRVQGWSETINAKYFMSCNRKPRFVDPTKGVWRRLKYLKFESSISERQEDRNLAQKIIASELPGIVNWAVRGLLRLYKQNGFTISDILKADLTEYQADSDSVAQFRREYLRPAEDNPNGWYDLRPIHDAYKAYCLQIAVPPVGEPEFRSRLIALGVIVDRPAETDIVNNCPEHSVRMPGLQYWAVKGYRCYHHTYMAQNFTGLYVPNTTRAPMTAAGVS